MEKHFVMQAISGRLKNINAQYLSDQVKDRTHWSAGLQVKPFHPFLVILTILFFSLLTQKRPRYHFFHFFGIA
jgi:hypothetical protein